MISLVLAHAVGGRSQPHLGKEKRLRDALARLCSNLKGVGLLAGADGDETNAEGEYYPYVWYKLQAFTA